jgi:hypothetical protein
MREFLGGIFILNIFLVGIFLLREKTVDLKSFMALTLIGTFAGFIISQSNNISQLVITGGKGQSVTVQMQKQVDTVNAKAEEVKQLEEKTQDLAKAVETAQKQIISTSGEVKTAEQNVQAMQNGLREACKAFLVPSMFTVAEARMIHGIPKRSYDDIEKHFDILASFAYPNEKERRIALDNLKRMMPGGPDYGK